MKKKGLPSRSAEVDRHQSGTREMTRRAPFLLSTHSLLIFVIGVAVFWNSLNGSFVFDDDSAVTHNKDLRVDETPLLSIFSNDFWGYSMSSTVSHKSYRPVLVMTMRLNYWIHELDVWGYHFVNVGLHGLVSVLLALVLADDLLLGSPHWATFAGILFALHPVHCDSVASVVGRGEVLAALLFLVSFLCYRQCTRLETSRVSSLLYLSICLALSFLSMLSKEQGLTVLGVCGGYEVLLNVVSISRERERERRGARGAIAQGSKGVSDDQKTGVSEEEKAKVAQKPGLASLSASIIRGLLPGAMIRVIVLVSFLLLCLWFRGWIMAWQPPVFRPMENIIPYLPDKVHRGYALLYVWFLNARLLLYPSALSVDWTGTPLPTSFFDSGVLASVLLLACMAGTIGVCLWSLVQGGHNSKDSDIQASEMAQHVSARVGVKNERKSKSNSKSKSKRKGVNNFSSTLASVVWHVTGGDADRADSSFQVLFGLVLLLVPLLPACHLFFYAGFIVAERVLYTPSMGFCLLCTLLCRRLYGWVTGISTPLKQGGKSGRMSKSKRKKSKDGNVGNDVLSGASLCCIATALLLFALLGQRTWARNADWSSPVSLLQADTTTNPHSQRLQRAYCGHLSAQKRYVEATHHCQLAVEAARRNLDEASEARARTSLCVAEQNLPDPDHGHRHKAEVDCKAAIEYYNQASEFSHSDKAQAYSSTCALYLALGDFEQAEEMCAEALAVEESLPGLNEQMCAVIAAQVNKEERKNEDPTTMQRLRKAEEHCKRAVQVSPESASVYSNYCGMLVVDQAFERGEAICKEAVRLAGDPNSIGNLIVLYWESGRGEDAVQECQRAIREYPNAPTFPTFLCTLQTHLGQSEAALQTCHKALQWGEHEGNRYNFCFNWEKVYPGEEDPVGVCSGNST